MNLKYWNVTVNRRAMIVILVLQFVLGNYWIAQASTQLIFRTSSGNQSGPINIPLGKTTELGLVDVHQYGKIRVCAYERTGSASKVRLRFLVVEGNDVVGELDPLMVTPSSAPTKVFDAPGVRLKILAESERAVSGSNIIEVVIYGWNSLG